MGFRLAAYAAFVLSGVAGLVYEATAVVAGVVFLAAALDVFRHDRDDLARKAAGRLFGFSIVYLFVLYAALLAEWALRLWA